MRRLALLMTLLASPLLAAEPQAPTPPPCQCGEPSCEAACTCSAGQCPLHRPKKAPAPTPPPPRR
jgi:hypothetical protein